MIRLRDDLWIDPDDVSEVLVEHGCTFVLMKHGRRHSLHNDYGKSEWDTMKRIVSMINEERKKPQ